MYMLMGQAGSGKGTQSELLAEKLSYDYFSTGQYLRSFLDDQRKKEMLKGKLLDDSEMIKIIESYLERLANKSRCILDGFPRTIGQASWLMAVHRKGDISIEGIVFLDVPEAELTKRMLSRARQDDTLEAIKKRFKEYRQSTAPVIDFFKENNIEIFHIDGQEEINKVQENILKSLNKLK